MGVALAALADQRDLLFKNTADVGVAIIIDTHRWGLRREGVEMGMG